MADTEKQTLKLDLDSKEFFENALKAKNAILGIGDSENLAGLIEGLTKTIGILGLVGTALYGVKKAMDIVLEGESIQKIGRQFELLATSVGQSSVNLKESLVEASKGLIDDTDLMEAANRGMVQMGENSKFLTRTLELARKASSAFGGDIVANWEKINQALATGNLRTLRQYGITLDTDRALREYAKSIGVAVQDLTDAEKKQAVFNAGLEKTEEKFKSIIIPTGTFTERLQKLKTEFKDLGENIVVFLSEKIKPAFDIGFAVIDNKIKFYTDLFNKITGRDASKPAPKPEAQLIQEEEARQESFRKSQEHDAVMRESKIKFQQESLKIKAEGLQQEADLETNYEQLKLIREEQVRNVIAQQNAEITLLEVQRNEQKIGTDEELAQRKVAIAQKTADEIRKIANKSLDDEVKAAERAAQANERSFQGIASGAKATSTKASQDFNNFSKIGSTAVMAVGNNSAKAFESIGDGSQSAGDAMRGFVLNALADIAEAQGRLGLLSFFVNPAAAAAGAALMVLAGVLRAAAGHSKASSGGVGGSSDFGSSYSSTSSNPNIDGTTPITPQPSQAQRHITINIHGSYFETDQTRRALMEMIRQESDNSDFNYFQINPGVGS